MAELYLARQVGVMGFERVLAIKRILPHLTEDAEFVQMFINEAKIAAQITHPNVVQIYDFGTVNGTYYIAMEYVMGKSLSAVLPAGRDHGRPMPGHLAVHIAAKIAAGLEHAYRGKTMTGQPLGIIHRDISPQNILLGYNGDVKLVDFGIAKAASSANHTQTGLIKGKLAYLAPEQAWGKAIDQRTDLFSLGIVLHEMLTGQRLFKAENEFATLERVRTAHVTPPSAVNAHVSKALDPIVIKALAREPEHRYPTAQAFQEALEGYLLSLGALPTHRDLAEYLQSVFAKDLEMDAAEFKQATTITKSTVTATTPIPSVRPPVPVTRTMQAPVSAPPVRRRPLRLALGMTSGLLIVSGVLASWWWMREGSAPLIESLASQPMAHDAAPVGTPAALPAPSTTTVAAPTTSEPEPEQVSVQLPTPTVSSIERRHSTPTPRPVKVALPKPRLDGPVVTPSPRRQIPPRRTTPSEEIRRLEEPQAASTPVVKVQDPVLVPTPAPTPRKPAVTTLPMAPAPKPPPPLEETPLPLLP
jgi:serine/threonine-protein kinase